MKHSKVDKEDDEDYGYEDVKKKSAKESNDGSSEKEAEAEEILDAEAEYQKARKLILATKFHRIS